MVYNPMGNGGGLVGGGIPSGMFSPARKKRGGASGLPKGKAAVLYADGNQSQNLHIDRADYTGLDLSPDSDVTFEAWVNPDAYISSMVLIGRANLSTHAYSWVLTGGSVGQSGLQLSYSGGSLLVDLDANGVSVLAGEWHHFALSRNRATGRGRAYVDGVFVAEDADGSGGAGDFTTPTYPMMVGRQNNGSVSRWAGKMAEIRIWHAVRSDDDILANYNKTLAGTEDNLVAYYRFDDNFEDSSPNLNHLDNTSLPAVTLTEFTGF